MRNLNLLVLHFFIVACATRYSVSDDYSHLIQSEHKSARKNQTVILFLVDGLPFRTLESMIHLKELPAIKNHFLKKETEIHQAYSAFPSLTYTNIAGLLTEKPVHLSMAYGNSLNENDKIIRFEDVLLRSQFADRLKGKTIFSRLTSGQENSVSLDYGLGAEATVSSGFKDLKSGLAAGLKDYIYLDQKRIDSLENLLKATQPEKWPRFIFVHLIGVDFLSHELGPESIQVKKYLAALDHRLGHVLQLIEKSDSKSHQTISVLTADHGFALGIKKRYAIEKAVSNIDAKALTLNEGRMAAVFTKKSPETVARNLLIHPEIETVASLQNDELTVQSAKQKIVVRLVNQIGCLPSSKAVVQLDGKAVCPEFLDSASQDLFYPHFILNLIYYFQAAHHPDVIIIPAKQISFSFHEVGVHGGPTRDEIEVPVLLRNAVFPKQIKTPAIWELLQFI